MRVILNDGLSCKFVLHNICRIQSFLTKDATQLLVQAMVISHPDYCSSPLAWLPGSAIKPLQRIQNAAAHIVFMYPNSPLWPPPLWPSLTSCHGLHPVQDDKWNCTRLPPNTGQTTCPSTIASFHYISWPAGTAIAEVREVAQQSHNSSLLWHVSGRVNSRPMPGQQSHLLSSANDSRLTYSDLTSTPRSMAYSGCENKYLAATLFFNTSRSMYVCGL